MAEAELLDQEAETQNIETEETKTGTTEKEVEESFKKEDEDQPRDSTGKFAKKDSMPVERHKEILENERAARAAAEARLAEAEGKLKRETQSESLKKMEDAIEGLEKEHTKLLLDGEHEKAAAVMKQIRYSEREIARIENEDKTSRATAQAVEQVRYDAAVARLESTFDVLNPDSDNFNESLVDIVLAEQERLIRAERMSPSQALTAAGHKVMKMFDKATPAATQRGLGEGRPSDADRKAEQVKKNLEAAARQAPDTKDAGMDSDRSGKAGKIDVTKMSVEEWSALPEATKAKLRGDVS
jgi:hypothetical protein